MKKILKYTKKYASIGKVLIACQDVQVTNLVLGGKNDNLVEFLYNSDNWNSGPAIVKDDDVATD